MTESNVTHRIAAGAIIEHNGRIALVNHRKTDAYDFWVCPGGGVIGSETLHDSAKREVFEESGITVEIGALLYIEELARAGLRECKFWFAARYVGGEFNCAAPEAITEHIVQATWMTREEIMALSIVFPPVMQSRYWDDRARDMPIPVYLGVRQMAFW